MKTVMKKGVPDKRIGQMSSSWLKVTALLDLNFYFKVKNLQIAALRTAGV